MEDGLGGLSLLNHLVKDFTTSLHVILLKLVVGVAKWQITRIENVRTFLALKTRVLQKLIKLLFQLVQEYVRVSVT